MNHPRQTRTATPALAWLLGALCLSWLPGALPADVAFERETVMVETTKGSFPFRVEVARTPPQLGRGLMYRDSLAPDAGMIFLYPEVAPGAMWMKNTLISLDMLFIGGDARIQEVVADTVPLSETIIMPRSPVRAVLEVPAGTASRLGVRPGDRVHSTLFETF